LGAGAGQLLGPGENANVQVTPPPPPHDAHPAPQAGALVDEPESDLKPADGKAHAAQLTAEEEEELRMPGSFDLAGPTRTDEEVGGWGDMLRKMHLKG
jgi:hypothetical protein